eukprot:scaffold126264_cov40-Prasinocladus_malaysianus.AAC.1
MSGSATAENWAIQRPPNMFGSVTAQNRGGHSTPMQLVHEDAAGCACGAPLPGTNIFELNTIRVVLK